MKEILNSVSKTHPELVEEWHPIKNGDLTPDDVPEMSDKKVWWQLLYTDPKTGKKYVFEWQAIVKNRCRGQGCPYLSGKRIWVGYNDLQTTDPNLAKEWHPTKNGEITPQMVMRSTNKKYWWLYPYDDPITGKHFDFEWEASVNSRSRGKGCPFLVGKGVWPGYNDLESSYPKIAEEWHPSKNGNLTPRDVTTNSYKKVWWLGKCGHEWQSTISHRTRGHGCIYCAKSNAKLLPGYNDLQTVYPDIAKEWHPTKNGNLTPDKISARNERKVWWLGNCGHEWSASIHNRTGNRGCPICAKEYKSSFPEQAIFYYVKLLFPDATNGDRKELNGLELDIFIPSKRIAIEYDGYSWHKTQIRRDCDKALLCKDNGIRLIRIREKGLPSIDNCENIFVENTLNETIYDLFSLIGKELNISVDIDTDKAAITKQFLSSRHRHKWWEQYPELLDEWNYEKNGNFTPYLAMLKDKVWWKCRNCGQEWETTITHRTRAKTGCPNCGRKKTAKAKYKKVKNTDTGEVFLSLKDALKKVDMCGFRIVEKR